MDIYCINLEERKDRWEAQQKNIKENNFKGNLIRLDGEKRKSGSLGCGLSHLKAINLAKENKMESILVIEDDCVFNENSYDLFCKCRNQLPEEWDILVGGTSWIRKINKRESENLVKLEDFAATHFMYYHASSYDKILKWNESYRPKNIDRYIGSLSKQNKLKVYCSSPFIANQAAGKSDVTNRTTNYTKLFQTCENKVVQFKS